MRMKKLLIGLSFATILCAFGAGISVSAQIIAPPTPHLRAPDQAVADAVPAVVTPPTLVQDTDQPARAPFTVTVPININNFTYTPVKFPVGKRLVVDYVSVSGAAQSNQGGVQPIIILNATVKGVNALFYFAPPPNANVPGQFYHSEQATIYADSLSVGPAFSGFTPSFMAFNVVITGHIVSLP